MPAMEQDFPRGGSTPRTKSSKQKAQTEGDLFKTSNSESDIKKGKKRKSSSSPHEGNDKKAKKSSNTFTVPRAEAIIIEPLTKKIISTGMLILGSVKDIHDYELTVSLPNGWFGTVSIRNVSEAFTKKLHSFLEDPDSAMSSQEQPHNLFDLFNIGQLVICKVLGAGKQKLKLSINPVDVHQSLMASHLKNNMVLYGSISSVEDHGYIVDLGVKKVQAFLSSETAQKFSSACNEGKPLIVGQNLPCQLKNVDKSSGGRVVVTGVSDPKILNKTVLKESMEVTFLSLLPGMKVNSTVTKISENGLNVNFLSYKGHIHKSHLPQQTSKYETQQKVRGIILFIEPTSKLVHLSLLPHLMLLPRPVMFQDLSKGDIIEEGVVKWLNKKKGVYIKIGEDAVGFAQKSHLDDKQLDINLMAKKFKCGSVHRCRIMNFNHLENVVLVTMKESILSQQFVSYKDVHPGQVIECQVRNITGKGISVKVTNQIRGFIPSIQLAEVPLRHPEKKFQADQKLKCKVLSVDSANSKLILTNKKSLVNSKFPSITQYEDIKPGGNLQGFIASVKNNGVLVVFYNSVKGWVPKKELSSEMIDYPEKVFFPGQVVVCRCLTCYPSEERLILSLKIEGKPSFGTKGMDLLKDVEIGKLLECEVIKKAETGIDVQIISSKIKAFIPKMHLSDYSELCQLLWETYKPGEIIKEALCFGTTSTLILTCKQSMIQAANDGMLVKEFDELKPGMMVPCCVHNMMSYGYFLELPNRLVGLVPNKFVSDKKLSDYGSIFATCQSLVAKVTEVDIEKRRFLMSLRMCDCFHGDTDIGIDLLSNYLEQGEMIRQKYSKMEEQHKKMSSLKVGSIVMVTVTKITKHGALCRLQDGCKGFATNDHMLGAENKTGNIVEAIVLYVDFQHSCVELSISHDLTKVIKHLNDNKLTVAKVGQNLKSEVLLIKEDFILVLLRGHASGRLAFLPARKHLNDVFEKKQFIIGQQNQVVIKRNKDGQILAVLQMHENNNPEKSTSDQKSLWQKSHEFKPGMKVKASIRGILDFQMNISIGGIPGRVHITEVTDDIEQGKHPFKGYAVDQDIDVKIIGFRDVKTKRYLPISHPNLKKALPECTLKTSKLSNKAAKNKEPIGDSRPQEGDTVQAFVHKYANHCLWMWVTPTVQGKVYVLNLSDNNKVLANPMQHFKPGTAHSATVIEATKEDVVELSLVAKPNIVTPAATTKAVIINVSPQTGLMVQLTQGYLGRVAPTDLMDDYKDSPTSMFREGQFIDCSVVSSDAGGKDKTVLSLRKSRLHPSKQIKVSDPEIRELGDIEEGRVLRGFIKNCSDKGVFISLGTSVTGHVQYSHLSEYFIKDPQVVFFTGKVVTVKVLSINRNTMNVELSLLKKDTGVIESIPKEYLGNKRLDLSNVRKRKTSLTEDNARSKKLKSNDADAGADTNKSKTKKQKKKLSPVKKKSDVEEHDSGVDIDKETEDEPAVKLVRSEVIPAKSLPCVGAGVAFDWSTTFTMPVETSVGEDEKSSGDSEDEAQPVLKKKSKRQLEEEARNEENILYQTERKFLEHDIVPKAASDFDRLVLQSPDSSILWIRYMTYHLESSEIEKARAVAERALSTISFREEQEKLNVWVAYLNLENMYGTQELLQSLFERATHQNEPWKVYKQLVNIYVQSDKSEHAEQLYNTMLRKFRQDKSVWIDFGTFYFKTGRAESARKLMQRSMMSLVKTEHVDVITKFAQLEFKFGEPERGKTMFENVLSTYAKRVDLWSVYIDVLIKAEDIKTARQLFERMLSLNLKPRKMKFVFKKYMDFEEKYGNDAAINNVKEKARQYVESKT